MLDVSSTVVTYMTSKFPLQFINSYFMITEAHIAKRGRRRRRRRRRRSASLITISRITIKRQNRPLNERRIDITVYPPAIASPITKYLNASI
jgi:hypothetical protein